MNPPPKIAIMAERQPPGNGVTRRAMLQKVLAGLGATLAGSATAVAHPMYKYLSHPAHLEGVSAKVAGSDWSPEFVDPDQNKVLLILSEAILPGSTEAQVNRMIDLLLTVDTKENQEKFAAALAAFEFASSKRFGKPIASLSPKHLDELLSAASTVKRGRSDPDDDASSSGPTQKPPTDAPATIRDHFENLKGWVVATYYSSEIGMRELGWTEQVFFTPAGCTHPDSHT